MLASDNRLAGEGVACLLAGVPDVDVVGRARTHDEMAREVTRLTPDAVLLLLSTGVADPMSVIHCARVLHTERPELGMVVVADRGNGFALELLRGGSSRIAYLLTEELAGLESLLEGLREVMSGHTVLDPSIVDQLVRRRNGIAIDQLSVREVDVLEQMAHGHSNQAIAQRLHVTAKAVENHITSIFRKLDLTEKLDVDRRVTSVLAFQHAGRA